MLREERGVQLTQTRIPILAGQNSVRALTYAGGRINYTLKAVIESAIPIRVVADNFELRVEGADATREAVERVLRAVAVPGFFDDAARIDTLRAGLPPFRRDVRGLTQEFFMLGSRCYNCGGGANGSGEETPNVGNTTATARVTTSGTAGSNIAVDVRSSSLSNNQLQILADGLFVAPSTGTGLTSASLKALFGQPVTAADVVFTFE